jgi:hypothetical protein
MMASNMIRLCGLTAMLGGVLWITVWAIEGARPVAPPGGYREGWESFNIWSGVAVMLTMIGLTGAYFLQMRRIGWIGHAGFVLPWIGITLMGAGRLGQALEIGNAWILVILGAFVLTIGIILFGVATLRAKVLPFGAGLLLLAAGLMLFLVDPENRRAFLALPYGAAWLWIGYVLWSGRDIAKE